MIAAALTLLLAASDPYVGCLGTPAEQLCRQRRRAHDAQDFPRMYGLIALEVAAVQTSLSRPITPGALQPLCLPLEAGFNVCNERRPEHRCAEYYLDQYIVQGCLEDPAQRPRFHNMHAMYWHRRMDYPRALDHLNRAESMAWGLWLTQWDEAVQTGALVGVVVSMSLRAQIAAALRNTDGLSDALVAIEILRARLDGPELVGLVAGTLNALAWSLLMAREAELVAEDPSPLLAAALKDYTTVRPDPGKADGVRINLALAALQREDLEGVRRWTGEIAAAELGDEDRMWLRLVQIRAETDARDPRATADWQAELDAIAARERVAMAAWFAAWARGLRMERAGRPSAAITAYEAAEAELEAQAHASVEPGALADRLHLSFAAPTRRLVQLLVESGDLERAVAVTRSARSRALRAASRRHCASAGLVSNERPEPDDLRLIYFRVSPRDAAGGATRWIGLAVTHRAVHGEYIEVPPIAIDPREHSDQTLERWSDALLEPFADEITEATSIEILATDTLHAVPFHALPWDGEELIDHVPVRHGLDLATCGAHRGGVAGSALVLSGDDRGLVSEAEAVAQVLRAGGRPTEQLVPDTPAALGRAMTDAHAILHLAAHGTRPEGSEMFASDDRLLLQGALTLSRPTILASARVPALVFLSACQASYADGETLGGGISLAHAFLLRGARFVVGPVHDIDGEVAKRFATHFYRELANDERADVPAAWRAAYRSTRATIAASLRPHLRMLRLHTP